MLRRECPSFPLEANSLLEQVIDFNQLMWLVREEDIKTMLLAGINSQYQSAKDKANLVINKGGEPGGDFRFMNLLHNPGHADQ